MMRMEAVRQAWNDLPLADLDTILQGRVPVILAPHPDDESIGCGGLTAQACAAGVKPQVVILTDGCRSHPNSPSYPAERLRHAREREAQTALGLLGLPIGNIWFLGLEDTAMPRVGPAFQLAARRVLGICEGQERPVLLTAWRHDPHCDHEAAAGLAVHVAGRAGIPLLSYPVWGWTLPDDAMVDEPFPHGWRLDIGDELDVKEQAIKAHATQYGDLIKDDPGGFKLPESLLTHFPKAFEVYLAS
jgi:LmbE family N-acetylglucosaminyl deacetylase